MTDSEQELADLIAKHAQEREYYGGRGLGSPVILYHDIRAWMKKYYPDELRRSDEENEGEDD
jgi:hypothetical protein